MRGGCTHGTPSPQQHFDAAAVPLHEVSGAPAKMKGSSCLTCCIRPDKETLAGGGVPHSLQTCRAGCLLFIRKATAACRGFSHKAMRPSMHEDGSLHDCCAGPAACIKQTHTASMLLFASRCPVAQAAIRLPFETFALMGTRTCPS